MLRLRVSRILNLTAAALILAAASTVGQMDWKEVFPTVRPTRRGGHGMAYDAARKRVLMFGGHAAVATIRWLGDTWDWDGQTWTERKPARSPSARVDPAMAYDEARQRVVMFGGGFGAPPSNRVFDETWEWNGQTWYWRFGVNSPPARSGHAMAYDRARRRIVLFGGAGVGPMLGDTWEWDGTNWTQCKPATSPPGRRLHAMAYDPIRQRVVLFGGDNRSTTFTDMWEWDGKDWTKRTQSGTLPRGWSPSGPTMVYDAARQRMVLYTQAATFEWDGTRWRRYVPPTLPVSITRTAAYDAARGSTVMFGHWFGVGDNTLLYSPTDLTASSHFVSVATGGNVRLALVAGTMHAGRSYLVSGCIDTGAPRGISLGGTMVLLSPDDYFWFNLVSPNTLIENSFGRLDASGQAAATVHVPRLPAMLIGSRFYHAYVVFGTRIDYASTPVPATLIP